MLREVSLPWSGETGRKGSARAGSLLLLAIFATVLAMLAVTIFSCSSDRGSRERTEILAKARARHGPPPVNAAFEMSFFRWQLVSARWETLGSARKYHSHSYLPGNWPVGAAENWGWSRAAGVMAELSPTVPQLLEVGDLELKGNFAIFHSKTRLIGRADAFWKEWRLQLRDNGILWPCRSLQSEVGVDRRTGMWVWTLDSIDGRYARLRVRSNLPSDAIDRIRRNEGFSVVASRAELERGVSSWFKEAPDLNVAAPWLVNELKMSDTKDEELPGGVRHSTGWHQ